MSAILHAARGRLEAFATREVSSRSLGILRLFGSLTIYVEFASPWVIHRTDDSTGTAILVLVLFAALNALTFGFKTRYAAIVAATCFAGLHLYYGVEQGVEKLIPPVFEFQMLVLFALTPCGRSLSIDRALEVRRALAAGREPPAERVEWWKLELFVVALASVHLWMAIDCTIRPEWLAGLVIEQDLLRLWSGADQFVYRPRTGEVAVAAAWIAMIAAYLIAFGLLLRRWRRYFAYLAVVLHFAALFAFANTYLSGYYNLMFLAALIACLDPTRVHEFIALQGDQGASAPKEGE